MLAFKVDFAMYECICSAYLGIYDILELINTSKTR